ncbi:MAG: SRPBCC family protein [Flavitalea sp.]
MPILRLHTLIHAPPVVCFNASRDIDLHVSSMRHTNEKAIAGKTTGLIGLHESVIWEARHFFIRWHMTVKITQFDPPYSFTDEMISGPFARMQHVHGFAQQDSHTLMTDHFDFASPFGLIGKAVDWLALSSYMRDLLELRNVLIRSYAEKSYLVSLQEGL